MLRQTIRATADQCPGEFEQIIVVCRDGCADGRDVVGVEGHRRNSYRFIFRKMGRDR